MATKSQRRRALTRIRAHNIAMRGKGVHKEPLTPEQRAQRDMVEYQRQTLQRALDRSKYAGTVVGEKVAVSAVRLTPRTKQHAVYDNSVTSACGKPLGEWDVATAPEWSDAEDPCKHCATLVSA